MNDVSGPVKLCLILKYLMEIGSFNKCYLKYLNCRFKRFKEIPDLQRQTHMVVHNLKCDNSLSIIKLFLLIYF